MIILDDNLKYVPGRENRTEIVIQKSRFIASAAFAFSVEMAKEYIKKVKDEFPNADHHVTAYIIGHGKNIITHSSDDGEPSGTAGRPTLQVLIGGGIGDIVVVITRYFGGVKLGTGGLVRAYTDAAKTVMSSLKMALKIQTCTLQFMLHYSNFEKVKQILKKIKCNIISIDYGSDVCMTIQIPVEKGKQFIENLDNVCAGKTTIRIIVESEETIIPIEET